MNTTESWYFELLGGVSVRSGSRQLEDLVGKKPGALLALLALSPGRTRPREEVIDLIWPEVDFDNARNRFKQTLAALRKQLEPAGVVPGSVLIADRSQVGIAAVHKSDVAEFQHALRSAAMATEPLPRAQHLRTALALYQGEFAPGFYLDVLLTERERLNALAQSARERLAELEATQTTEAALPITATAPTVSLHPTNAFFGRRTERDHLAFLLTEHRLVTLLGPGGTGKTRLAQELQTSTPHAHFISLSSLRNGASIPDAIVSALALPDSTEPARERLKTALADTLLVLDNFEQLVARGGPEALSALLEAIPTLRLLVTSRLKLNLAAEQVFPLTPLPEGDALALFCDRAHLAHPHFALTEENEEAVSELCRRLDGLPLAIELAAARAAILTPQQILERLSRRFDLLADKRRDREERHTSLRAALDWGWSLLAPDVQRFFTQLCIFRGSFSLEAAEAVTGEFLAIDYLQSLADSSFLVMEVGGERFRLLETLREYGLEKLSKDDRDVLTRTHAEFFIAKTAQWKQRLGGAALVSVLLLFKQEQGNFTAALDRTLISTPNLAVDLCINLCRFWHYSYSYSVGLSYLEKALDVALQHEIAAEKIALIHSNIGNAYEVLGDPLRARPHYQSCSTYLHAQLVEQVALGDDDNTLFPLRRRIAGILHNLGTTFYPYNMGSPIVFEEDLDTAQRHYQEALRLNEAIGNDDWRARNLFGLYTIAWKKGVGAHEPTEQTSYFKQALEYVQAGEILCRKIQQDFFLCYMLGAQAEVLPLLGQQEQILPILKEGFEMTCLLEHKTCVITFLNAYYHQALYTKRWEEATQFQGAISGYSRKWDVPLLQGDHHLRRQVNLPEILGTVRYELLYEAGAQASLEALQTLAAGFHTPTLRQKQAQ